MDQDLVLEFLIKQKGAIELINDVKDIGEQTKLVTKLAQTMAREFNASVSSMVVAIKGFNNESINMRAKGINVSTLNPAIFTCAEERAKEIDAVNALKNIEKEITIEKKTQNTEETAIVNKKQQQLDSSIKLTQVMAQYGSQLASITKMIPADQSMTLAKLVPQMAAEAGLPINTIMREIQTKFNILPDTIRKATQEIRQFQNGIQGTLKEVLNLNSIMNTAFGVGMAMLIFQLQMQVSKFFTDTIQQAKDLSNAIGKISIAEQVMSKGGVEVTGKELLDIVKELEKEFTNVSNVDMLKATGDMALRLAGTGFTPQELKGLLEVANAAKIRNPDRTLEDIMGTVAAAAMSGQVEGVRNLGGGLSVAATDVQEYAKKVGMIKDVNDKLTEEQKLHARAGVLIEQNNKSLKETLTLQDNLANAGDKLNANWKNLIEKATFLVDGLNAIIYLISYALQGWTTFIGIIQGTVEPTNNFQRAVANTLKTAYDLGQQFLNYIPIVNGIKAAWNAILFAYETVSGKKVSELPSIINLEKQDTPTGLFIPDITETEDNADKIKKALNDLFEVLDGFYDRATNAEEDYQTKSKNDWDDYYDSVFGERTRFLQDWEIDRAKILADAEKEIAEKTADANKKKLDAEAKFLEDLRQLREKYLMNLDDALHARDARQILRLVREYAMNKQNLINEYNLRKRTDDANQQKEVTDIVAKRDQRLAELDAENALKLKRMDEDFKVKQERAKKEHEIEMQRLEQEKQDRLRQLANSLGEQLNLTDAGNRALYSIYDRYFGPSGYINKLMDMSFQNTSAHATELFKLFSEISKVSIATASYDPYQGGAPFDAITSAVTSASTGTSLGGGGGFRRARGGLDIATKPTPLIFGDAGPELALTVPLNQISNLGGSVASLFGQSGKGDKMEILLTLSPDLEARVIDRAVGQVEDAIVTVRRNTR